MSLLQCFVSVPAVTLAVLLTGATIASAQSASVVVSGTASSTAGALVPGSSGANLSAVTLNSSAAGPVYISSLPLTLSSGNGATIGDLSSCQLFNSNGTALNTGTKIVNSVQGTNTVVFDTPLLVTGGTATSLSVRCNLSGSVASNGTFQFAVGTPTFAPALSVVTPSLTVASSVVPGAQDAVLANILLDASRSGAPISVTSIPLNISAGGGGSVSYLSDCRVRNPIAGNAALNGTANVVVNGINPVALSSALTIPAGTATLLTVTCDVSAAAATGNTFQIGVAPTALAATAVGSGNAVVPTGAVSGNLTSSGSPVLVLAGGTPGIPDTSSGDAAPYAVLALSALAAVIGALYLRRKIA